MSKKDQNRRKNLIVPVSIVARLDEEFRFLNFGQRFIVIEEQEIKSKADFIRLVVGQFCTRFLDQPIDLPGLPDEDTTHLPFYMDRRSEGLWDSAIREGAAQNYNDLVTIALFEYFARQVETARATATQIEIYKQRLQNIDLSQWKEMV